MRCAECPNETTWGGVLCIACCGKIQDATGEWQIRSEHGLLTVYERVGGPFIPWAVFGVEHQAITYAHGGGAEAPWKESR